MDNTILTFIEANVIIIAVALILAIVIRFYIAEEFHSVACDKGYESRKYFWISFIFGLAGYILVAALPVKKIDDNEIE